MKYIYLYIICFIAFFSSCQVEDIVTEKSKGNEVTLEFYSNVEYTVHTRSYQDAVSELYVLLFDEDGLFLKREKATLDTNQGTFSVTLPETKEKRIIHFVAGYDWTGFDDFAAQEKAETILIPSLGSSENLVFWQRHELAQGIYENCLPGSIQLIRNMSKITISNSEPRLTDTHFAVYKKPTKGTIAPFRTSDNTFNIYDESNNLLLTEAAGMEYEAYDQAFIEADGNAASYVYERSNTGVAGVTIEESMFIIIRGKFNGSLTDTYYKIELYDPVSLRLLDIYRNHWYKVSIDDVGFAGYNTLEEALKSPASNNLTASVVLESYPSISNGEHVLIVEKTSVLFTENNGQLSLEATYKKLLDGTVLNNQISIHEIIEQDPANPVFKTTPTYNAVTGLLTADINDIIANVSRTAVVAIRGGNDLLRKVKVTLADPFDFNDMAITPATITGSVGTPVSLSFRVPTQVEEFLPIICAIYADGLSPVSSSLETQYTNNGWKYLYKIEQAGVHTLNFQTNKENSGEMVLIEADIFKTGAVSYASSENKYHISNVKLNPERAPFYTNQDVELRFTTASTATVRIDTDYLLAKSGQTGVIQETGYITYTPSSAGEQVLLLSTKEKNNGGPVKLSVPGHYDREISYLSQKVKITGTLTVNGTPATHRHPTHIHDLTIGCRFYIVRGYDPIFKKIDEIVGSFQTNLNADGTPNGTYETEIEADLDEVLYLIYTDKQFSGTNSSLPESVSGYTTININSPVIDKTHNFPYTPPGGG